MIQSTNRLCYHIFSGDCLNGIVHMTVWQSVGVIQDKICLCKQGLHHVSISLTKHRWFQRPIFKPIAAANAIFEANGNMPYLMTRWSLISWDYQQP